MLENMPELQSLMTYCIPILGKFLNLESFAFVNATQLLQFVHQN